MDKEGARLTTYRFTSPSGGVFSYTVENESEPGGGVEEMEAWEAEEASRDLWKKASRQQVSRFVGANHVAFERLDATAVRRRFVALQDENMVGVVRPNGVIVGFDGGRATL